MRKMLVFSLVSTVLFPGCGTGAFQTAQSQSSNPSRFTYTRIYCTPDTETHFENVTVELSKTNAAPPAQPLYAGGNRQVSSTLFLGADARWGTHDLENRLNHPAPAAQFVVVLAGVFSVTTTDGKTRQFSAGDVVRVEDTASCKGHITVMGDKPVYLVCAHDLGFRAYLSELIVGQGAQGRGIGRNLVERVQDELARRGRRVLIADVWHDAEPFYRSLGWESPDVVLLRRRLDDGAD